MGNLKTAHEMLFPLYVRLASGFYLRVSDGKLVRRPRTSPCYILAEKGLYQRKKGLFFTSSVRIWDGVEKPIGWLGKRRQKLALRLPTKVSRAIRVQAVGFFRAVLKKHGTEAILLLYWDTRKNRYKLLCPKQRTAFAGLDYDLPLTPDGLIRIGTIHSHCDFGAFHSGTDCDDEEHEDGVHVTIGDLGKKEPSYALSLVVDGKRQHLQFADVFEGNEFVPKRSGGTTFPAAWLGNVKAEAPFAFDGTSSRGTIAATPFLPGKPWPTYDWKGGAQWEDP